MNHMKKIPGWILVLTLINQIAFSQNNISVDKFTGTASATIPIHTINVDGYQYPIALQYTSGLQLNEKGGNVGVGWYLQAEGSITRNMRGLPDDYNLDPNNTDDIRRGWLFSTIGNDVHNFTPASDGNLTTCTDDNPVYNNLNNLGLNKDTEPDIFHIQVPGISGSFIYDKNGAIQMLNYQNVRIEEVRHQTDLYITGFYIYNEEGVRFGFSDMETTYMNTTGQTPPDYFLREFRLANTEFSFVSKWSLTSIQFPSGKFISFQYDPIYKYYAQDIEYDVYARKVDSGYEGDTLFTMHKIYKTREFDKIV